MDDRDTIRRRIIDRAADLFKASDPLHRSEGLFTTAHYGQSMKAEFRTPGPTLDGETCTGHLSQMGDLVEKAGSNLWRRKGSQADRRAVEENHGQSDASEPATSGVGSSAELLEAAVEGGVQRILSGDGLHAAAIIERNTLWWSIETLADAMKNNNLVWDGLLENMVGLVLYTMAVDGRVVARPNMLVDGARVTVFALVAKGEPTVSG